MGWGFQLDAELIDSPKYASMGPQSVDRVKTLLSKLDAARRSEQGGYRVAKTAKMTSGKFAGSVQKTFKSMPKPLEWQSFCRHDLNLLVQTPQEVRGGASRSINSERTEQIVYSMICALVLNKSSGLDA